VERATRVPPVALRLNRFWRTFGAGQPGENIFHRQRSPLIPLPVCLHKHPGVAKAYARLAPAVLFSIRLLPVRGVRQDQAHRGRTRASSSVKPARPYIWRLMVLSRLMWPSRGPLLHGAVIASSTARRSRRRVLPNWAMRGNPEVFAELIHSPSRPERRHRSMARNCKASLRTL
jgi:hypothetical protein